MNETNPHFQTDLSVGEILRRTRLHYNQTLPDIERALRIRASQLEALENGNYAQLPGRVYVIGFIRSYSEYLGLDGDKMVHLYKTQSGGKGAPPPQLNYPVMASDTKVPHGWQIVVSVIALLAVLTLWWTMQREDRSLVTDVPAVAAHQQQIGEPAPQPQTQIAAAPAEPQQQAAAAMPPQPTPVQNTPPETTASAPQQDAVSAEIAAAAATTASAPQEETPQASVENMAPAAGTPATAPAAAPEPQQASAPAAQKGVILNIKKNSWVEIRGKDGKSIVSRVLKAGDRYYVPDRPDLTISLGNSGGVEFEVEGQKLKPLGANGEVKRNIPLDTSYLKKNYGS